jgi:hypothetical protein
MALAVLPVREMYLLTLRSSLIAIEKEGQRDGLI